MKKTKLCPGFGLELTDLDVTELERDDLQEILFDLEQHGLLLFRKQILEDEALYTFSLSIGELEEPARKIVHSPGNSRVGYLTNLATEDGKPLGFGGNSTDYWHSDQEYRLSPATLATLYCLIPSKLGGTTSYASTVASNLGLPAAVIDTLRGLRVTYLAPSSHDNVERVEVAHPAILRSPRSGKESVYVSANTVRFIGLGEKEGQALKKTVLDAMLRGSNVYSHEWRMGDLILYDNTQLLHRRDEFSGIRWLKATKIFAPQSAFAVPQGLRCESTPA